MSHRRQIVGIIGKATSATAPPFAANSLWNTPIPPGSTYTTINWPADTGFNYSTAWDNFSPGVYTGTASDPLVTVTYSAGWGYPGPSVQVRIPAAVFTATISGTTMTVSAIISGTILTGMIVLSSVSGLVTVGTRVIEPQVSGPKGGVGQYKIDTVQTRASTDITAAVTGAVGTDSEILVINGTTSHNFWVFNRTGVNTATAINYAAANIVTDSGFGRPSPFLGAGISAIGSNELAGLLRKTYSDLSAIPYALGLRVDQAKNLQGFTAPAIAGDGPQTSSPPAIVQEGWRLGIPTGTSTPGGLDPLGLKIFNCLKTYGCFVYDQTGGVYGFRMNPLEYDAATVIAFSAANNAAVIRLLKRVT